MNNLLTEPYPGLADAICARVGFRGIDGWVKNLADYLSLPFTTFLPEQLVRSHSCRLDAIGVTLTFKHPHADYATEGDKSRWFLSDVVISYDPAARAQWLLPAPFQLDTENDSLNQAVAKLSDDYTPLTNARIAEGDRRQSFFLDNPQVVEITWREGMVGIEQIRVGHMGTEQDFILPAG